jgi:hypothetical protein
MHTVVMQGAERNAAESPPGLPADRRFRTRHLPWRECVGEDTCRLIPIAQETAADRPGSHRPVGQYSGQAAPFDESPTVALLDRWRTTTKQHNGRQIGEERPAAPSARFVHSVIFGDAPAPAGMDSEMIAAARRIARRLWPN